MIRQILMCSADMHLITYDWVDGWDYPWPDFSTNQFCRDYQSVHEWGKARVAKTDTAGGMLLKPANAVTRKLPAD
ncbi:hypothetical protein N7516_004873 [Penicillium verrucosum]|uniref:uncharacterized protein n=1 Tax=Penicillium verrucosum TaxID=60171 RepID=UPI0025450649|nr:uncharacterized protein N7516_004873 [Penicillium verrucosum]KAJ5944705.1 hypothetical protein N7516_004873 [Penicillium verrucosum]